jgi:hypothetical protein
MIATKSIYVNADWTKIVPAESKDAAYLLAGEGCEIHPDHVKKFGLSDEPKAEPKAKK